ncbi:mannose-6-phosphate isomerase, partial [Enterococcus faecium]
AGDLVVDGKPYPFEKGTSCIIPHAVSEWAVQGDLAIIASEPGK